MDAHSEIPTWALRIREERRQRLWSKKQLAHQLLISAGASAGDCATPPGLARMIAYWEAGRREVHERYQVLYSRVFDRPLADLFAKEGGTSVMPGGGPNQAPHPAPWEIVDLLSRSSIDDETLTWMEHATNQCLAMYPYTPPRSLAPQVSRIMRRLQDGLAGGQPLDHRRRCVTLLSWLAGVSASLAADLGRPSASAAYFRAAHRAAAEAGDGDVRGWLLANEAVIAHVEGTFRAACALLVEAVEVARAQSNPRRRAWVMALQARSIAADKSRAPVRGPVLSLLDESHAMLSIATEPPGGADFFDPGRLEGVRGTTLMHLGALDEAEVALGVALRCRSSGDLKGRALLQLDLARCRVLQSEPDEAASLAVASLDMAAGTVVRPVLTKVAELADQIRLTGHGRLAASLADRLAGVEDKLPKGVLLEVDD